MACVLQKINFFVFARIHEAFGFGYDVYRNTAPILAVID